MTNYKIYALIAAISFSFAYFAANYVVETVLAMLFAMAAVTTTLLFD